MSFSMIYFISGKFVLCEKRIHSKFSISVSRVVHCVPLSFSLWLHILLVVFPQRVIWNISAAELPEASVVQGAPCPRASHAATSSRAAPACTPSACGGSLTARGGGLVAQCLQPPGLLVPLPGEQPMVRTRQWAAPCCTRGARARASGPHGAGTPLALWVPPLRAFLLRSVRAWKA